MHLPHVMDNKLYDHPLYTARADVIGEDDRVLLSYHRARLVAQTWNLSIEDIRDCSPKFWAFQSDPILALDAAVTNILACHVNLFLGTLSTSLRHRPHLQPIVEQGLRAEFFGNFLLSEVGHGLDILNIETTATKVHDGFLLHTPHTKASKIMPPTTPVSGFPKMAVVMAKLIVDGEERGIHPFLVQTSDEVGICPGITSSRLPPRSGSSPLDFAITEFNQVRLPASAFLGGSLEQPENVQLLLHRYLWRIGLGTAILPVHVVNSLGFIATIGADYSYRRHVQGKGAEKIPIISFRTQQLPVLHSIAIAHVFKAWTPSVIEFLMSTDIDPRSRHGMGVVFKATVSRMTTSIAREMGERLGAQGLFGHNLVSQFENDNRGMIIAEGDVLVLSIRLFSELLLQRYSLPSPKHQQSLLARHCAGVFAAAAAILKSLPSGHRDPAFNNLVLPRSELYLTALGHALAYSAALDAGVPRPLLDIFEQLVVRQDEGWYVENADLTQANRMEMEDRAVQCALPRMKEYVDALELRKMFSIPIGSDETWDKWVPTLRSHRREAGVAQFAQRSVARL